MLGGEGLFLGVSERRGGMDGCGGLVVVRGWGCGYYVMNWGGIREGRIWEARDGW